MTSTKREWQNQFPLFIVYCFFGESLPLDHVYHWFITQQVFWAKSLREPNMGNYFLHAEHCIESHFSPVIPNPYSKPSVRPTQPLSKRATLAIDLKWRWLNLHIGMEWPKWDLFVAKYRSAKLSSQKYDKELQKTHICSTGFQKSVSLSISRVLLFMFW